MESKVYITSVGKFLPGNAISNNEVEDYLGRINGEDSRLKSRMLKNNGINTRYFAIDKEQKTLYRNSEMAAFAISDAIKKAKLQYTDVEFMAVATTQADLPVPGFASMVHGEIPIPSCEIASFSGVCVSGMMALKCASQQIKAGEKKVAISCASEFASRMFKNSRFESQHNKGKMSLDTEFLRWMLSDGAGAVVLQNEPREKGISLEIEWITIKSYADQNPVCMYAGANLNKEGGYNESWLDYPDFQSAGYAGALNLKQDVKQLEKMVKIGVDGFFELIQNKLLDPNKIDWLLIHYSSEFFKSPIKDLLSKGGFNLPEEKWFSNLKTKGNTGSASIYLMLEELMYNGKLKEGEQILCMIPESGRFLTSFMYLKVINGELQNDQIETSRAVQAPTLQVKSTPHSEWLVRELTRIWIDFENKLNNVPIVKKINQGLINLYEYKLLLLDLRQQVIDGSQWIARAASNIDINIFELRSAFLSHAGTEHKDYQILEKNFYAIGGTEEEIKNGKKNIGSEALSAWMFNQASKNNPIDLLGAMFIIEGLGNRMAGYWGTNIQKQLNLKDEQVSFLSYHGIADVNHFKNLETALSNPLLNQEICEKIAKTARVTARLYLMQLSEIGNY